MEKLKHLTKIYDTAEEKEKQKLLNRIDMLKKQIDMAQNIKLSEGILQIQINKSKLYYEIRKPNANIFVYRQKIVKKEEKNL